ncbi:MAG: DNA methylase, partial [Clostridiales bacterium]|nr:DNA methylase [Clostridiales bacterium]
RTRLFEVNQRVREVNIQRRSRAPGHTFTGKSCSDTELKADPGLELDFVIAPPQMKRYMDISTKIFGIYKRFVSPEDIHVYSIDEVFIDATAYLKKYDMSARELAMKMIREVLAQTGITATVGVGTNLYLSKIAMDIVAKHMPADRDGVRIAELDEMEYRKQLWSHTPLTDFWRVGKGYAKKLEANGLRTMGDIARYSIACEDRLYEMFGVNAELLIDHAWGVETCTIADIKAFKPETNSLSSGQVLSEPYEAKTARIVVLEMCDLLALSLVEKGFVTDRITINVCYDIENMNDPDRRKKYTGAVERDFYGREVPKAAHGSIDLPCCTSSGKLIMNAAGELYDRIIDSELLVRRMYVVAENIIPESEGGRTGEPVQVDMFTDPAEEESGKKKMDESLNREKKLQQAVIGLKNRFGRNAVLKGMNLEEGATAVARNGQIGGHKA